MLPLSLINTTQGHPMLVELKNGETYNGHLISCDNWMNITLREVILTCPDGNNFYRLPECFIRGNHIKYIRVPDEIMDKVKEDVHNRRNNDRRRDGGYGQRSGGGGGGGYNRGGGRGGDRDRNYRGGRGGGRGGGRQ